MTCLLSPAHLTALAAFQFYALLLYCAPALAPLPLAIFVLVSLGAPLFPRCSYYLPVISRGKASGGSVALTFDDGPSPEITLPLLDLLDRYSAKATFYVTGVNVERHPEIVRAILSRGHTLGNHSFSHSPFLMLKGARTLRREIESAQTAFKRFAVVPVTFRPPVGVTAPHLWRILFDLGMSCVNFSCRVGDMGNRRIDRLAERLLRKVRPGDIVLLHDVPPPNAEASYLLGEFEAILAGLRERNLTIQPLSRLIGREVMRPVANDSPANPIETFYDGFAENYDQEQFCSGVSLSRRKELALFTEKLPELFQGAERVLEIGAGTGIFTSIIARQCQQVVALDISGKMLAMLEQKCAAEGIANIRTRVGDAETIDLDGPYDVVCSFSALAYLNDLPAFFRRLAPHVRPGGKIYFITARTSLFRFFTQIGNAMRQGLWLRAHRRREIETMLTGAGFEVLAIESHLLRCLISGGMLLEVSARKKPSADPQPDTPGPAT